MERRRRTRKGTRSCWECKRKKIKCTFSIPTINTCDGCKRRGSSYIGQEFPEGPGDNRRQLGDRIGVVEELVGQLINDSRNPILQETSLGATAPGVSLEAQADYQHSSTSPYSEGLITASELPDAGRCRWSTLISDTLDIHGEQRSGDKYAKISQALLEAWPCSNDRNFLLGAIVGSTGFCGVVCTPYSGVVGFQKPSPEDILRPPSQKTHPVLIARKLIKVAAYLQGFAPKTVQQLTGLSISHHDIMHRAVETAVRLVTSNEDLVVSVEGIESIMIESMFQYSEGNLRRAYLSMRRALVLAQMIGLDKAECNNSPLLKFIDPETRVCIDPQQMWFRLLQSDRYLSLMLGLPQGTADTNFATPAALEGRTPMERMERIDCLAAGRIIQRNSADMQDLKVTQEIDKLLQDAAALMPPKWWLAPDLTSRAIDDKDAIQDTIRLINQTTHYHLLERLHLPYLLHSSTDPKYDYSRITAIIASRELLSRFVPFQGSRTVGSFCRGLDFLAFTASTALCLAHINSHHQRTTQLDGGGALLSFLTHQRPSDRGMLEQVLENMTDVARTRNDIAATKIASITRHLLYIEADAASGGSYTTNSSYTNDGEEIDYNGKISDGGTVLRIYIPYLGTIKIERDRISRSDTALPPTAISNFDPPQSEVLLTNYEQNQVLGDNFLSDSRQPGFNSDGSTFTDAQWFVPSLDLGNEWDLQGVDLAFFDSVFRFCGDE
ncbi:hypothetical protein AOL_s00004g69 [Orbilia oligospora ATCC 24927]|uniref:Zn(2)-C6 fungal-type domain-containing protein n=1 Tax=Arthrobotrys oligospora (strain ATCC 24927 / CBS 115.81 / DSM 1491) TaxID=756982 RepID=G1WXQ9_ARTOA|nr:hypothetical protein AOL_s00004g69 [Orbilia oligospora ATCC 24927]EGX54036.1 hypothetical protein AOL_s00004g69 [Orbilia oligospora ATCC 24927]